MDKLNTKIANKNALYAILDVCIAETYSAKCDVSQVIVMRSAVYGRMRIGRCVEQDYGHIGCRNDALDVLDAECSGRNECDVLVTIQKFWKDEAGSCLKALAGYIEAEYFCQEGKGHHQIMFQGSF